MNLSKAHTELDRLFDVFNERFFENKLIKPMIIIQSTGKKPINGYCTTQEMWKDKEDHGLFEMGISAEHLTRTVEELCGTLIHEMVHLYNLSNGIKDVAPNYVHHNKRFKIEAEKRGLIIEKAPRIGWSVTTLTEDTKAFVATLNVDQTLFSFSRIVPYKEKKPNKYPTYSYVCPACGEKIKSRNSDLRVICSECSVHTDDLIGASVYFEKEDKNE